MNSLANPLEKLKMKDFIHVIILPLYSSSSPSMDFKDASKGTTTQRRR
jgi:hypothetical protein